MKPIYRTVTALCIFCLIAAGCALPAPAAVPLGTPTAAPTSAPLYQQVTLTSVPSEESGQPFDYKITLQTPTLTGSDDPRAQTFNLEINDIISKAVADFKESLKTNTTTPVTAASTFDVRYKVISPAGNTVSLLLQMEGYVTGAAHPYHVDRAFNYDLDQGRDIMIQELFKQDADYLTAIANYCTEQLSTRDIGFTDTFTQGAAPLPENYSDWNISADGLVITFNEYQVAPYASGPQTVIVPYAELKDLIDPSGPLGIYVK